MGSIEAYDTAKGRRYRALYRRPDKKQTQRRGFTTKKAAELFLATTEVDITQGRYLDPSRARATVAEWLQTWIAARGDLRATTRSRVENIIAKHIVPSWGRSRSATSHGFACRSGPRPSPAPRQLSTRS